MDAVEMEKFYEENAVDGELPPEKTEELLQAALGGDVDTATSGETESGEAPDPAAAAKDEAPPEAKPEPEQEAKPETEPVIVAKDGRNTIPYSELADAREAAQNERSQREALERELAALKAKYEGGGDAEAGEAEEAEGAAGEEDNAEIAKLREDWPEVVVPVEGLLAKQQARIRALEEQIARMAPTTEQLEQERQWTEHVKAITTAHPDLQEIVNSKEFTAWREAQPGFMRQIFEHVIQQGTADQVIELLDGFKHSHPNWGNSPSPDGQPPRGGGQSAAASDNAARQAAVKAARERAANSGAVPRSLTDIPGGEAAPTDSTEAFMQKSAEAQLASMMNMTPEKREELLRRLT